MANLPDETQVACSSSARRGFSGLNMDRYCYWTLFSSRERKTSYESLLRESYSCEQFPNAIERFAVVGFGPVGLATAVAFASEGHDIIGIDVDSDRAARIVDGEAPFFEANLANTLHEASSTKLVDVTSDTARSGSIH